jgi:L,D-peptidoglycan transpeptidase YkuD (ErfK/YbiS/YcfS/YnhG family)
VNPADMVLTPTGLLFHRRRFPVTWGRRGITDRKREGDLCTPSGCLRIIATLYRPDRLSPRETPPWAAPIGLQDRWCDAPDHPDYNQLVTEPFGQTNERLRRADPLYDLVMITDWNWPEAVPYRGSAIFLHQWRRMCHPTAGCLAFRRDHLIWIARRAAPGTRLFIRPDGRHRSGEG